MSLKVLNKLGNGMTSKVLSALDDPGSMIDSAECVLAFGDDTRVSDLILGPPGAWFYPPSVP